MRHVSPRPAAASPALGSARRSYGGGRGAGTAGRTSMEAQELGEAVREDSRGLKLEERLCTSRHPCCIRHL
jgi:hypothetical protein